ncbi:hypothetical protein [Streptomyces sp. cmx-18-6]|uniref:hypothetical protein n=1 Tax=Streptomyces sp. cmx-18-6 TaxID=2790930 RepID=UPI00397FEC9E
MGSRLLELQAGAVLELARLLAFDQSPGDVLTAVLDGGFMGPEKSRVHMRLSRRVGTLLPMKWVTMAGLKGEPGYVHHAVVSRLMGNLTAPVLVDGRNDMERRESANG